jgi:tyrosyl-tRNA synthetase
LVERFHGVEAAQSAEDEFDRRFVSRELPEAAELSVLKWPASGDTVHLPALLASAFGISTSEGRRAIAQGGVKLDGETVGGEALDVPIADVDGAVLQLGKRRFTRVRVIAGDRNAAA